MKNIDKEHIIKKKEEIEITKNSIEKIIDRLKNISFKEAICKECLYLFYDPDFISTLDKNLDIICFKNGVYEKKTGKFRNGTREDLISIIIDSDYIECNEENKEEFNKIIEKFEIYRMNIIKKRIPKTLYNLTFF